MSVFRNKNVLYEVQFQVTDGQVGPIYEVISDGETYVAKTHTMVDGKTKLYYENTNYKYKINKLQSQHVINTPYMHDYFIDRGVEVLVLTKIPHDPISRKKLPQIAVALISSIENLHKLVRIIHFDIKPSNLIFKKTAKGHTLYLIDFDAAQPKGTTLLPLKIGGGGTPRFRSLNQAKNAGPYCDLESAAYTLKDMHSELPWDIDDENQKLEWITSDAETDFERVVIKMAEMAYRTEIDYEKYYKLFEPLMTKEEFSAAKKDKTILADRKCRN